MFLHFRCHRVILKVSLYIFTRLVYILHFYRTKAVNPTPFNTKRIRNCQIYLSTYVVNKQKRLLLQTRGSLLWLCFLMFWNITLKLLNSLTSIETFCCLGCNASDCDSRVRGFDSRLWFVCLHFVLLLLCVYLFPKHIICRDILQFL